MRHAIPIAMGLALALGAPSALAGEFTPGSLWVSAQDDHQVEGLKASLKPIGVVGDGDLASPSGLAFGPDGRLYVVSSAADRVLVFDGDGDLADSIGVASGLSLARGLAFGPDGHLYVGDGALNAIRMFDMDGTSLGSFGADSGMLNPVGFVFGPDGHLFVASGGAVGSIIELDPSGEVLAEFAADGELIGAGGLAFGPDGRLYVSSTGTDSVLVFDRDGEQVDELGESSSLEMPGGVAFGPDGLLYVASNASDQVLAFDVSDDSLVDSVAGVRGACQLAFAPWRLDFSAKGTLVTDDGASTVKQSGVLSVELGSQRAMLSLDAGDLVDALGLDVLVLAGSEASEDATAKTRSFVGGFSFDATSDGVGSLALDLGGKADKKSGAWSLKKAKGSWILASEDGLFVGSAKTGGLLK